MLKKSSLLGVGITNENEDNILKYLFLSLKGGGQKFYIVTPNPEMLTYANEHREYRKILNEAKIALPDGIGVFLGCGLMGDRLEERITGVDFMEEVCRQSNGWALKMGFLGGGPGVAEKTAECLKMKYPWIEVVFACEEWENNSKLKSSAFAKASFKARATADRSVDKQKLNGKSGAFEIDVLFVAFGHPKQEKWIYENLKNIPVKVAIGVGGAFDYLSGRIERAPFMIRAIGFEWLYRLIREPWRWRRQLALPRFVGLMLKERAVKGR